MKHPTLKGKISITEIKIMLTKKNSKNQSIKIIMIPDGYANNILFSKLNIEDSNSSLGLNAEESLLLL
jgi:hypothetical protein